MRSLITITAFTVAVATGALAGGNPEEEPTGFMTRERIEAPKPVQIPDQFQIQRRIEAEILLGSEGSDTLDNAPTMTATEIADEQDGGFGDCAYVFEWLADKLGGECHRDSEFHDRSPAGYHTVTAEKEVQVEHTKTKHKRFRHKKHAKHFARYVNKYADKIAQRYGYDEVSATRKGRKVTVKLSKTVTKVVTVTKRVRGDGRSNGGRNTAADSNFSDGGGGSGNRSRDY